MTTLETRFHESIPPSFSILDDNALSFRPASIASLFYSVEADNNKRRRLTARATPLSYSRSIRVYGRASRAFARNYPATRHYRHLIAFSREWMYLDIVRFNLFDDRHATSMKPDRAATEKLLRTNYESEDEMENSMDFQRTYKLS